MDGVVTVAVDAMGGDHAPLEIVTGAVRAARPGELEIVLVGDERAILVALGGGVPAGVTIRHASEVIDFHDDPAPAVRAKQDSSMVVAARSVQEGWAQAALSAGSTGAMLAACSLAMRRIPGVIRPGLAAVLPGRAGPVVLIDAGANSDPKADQVHQFAHMGVSLAQDVLGIAAPRCGLLTIGEEPGKGNALTKEVYALLADDATLPFAGNIEGRDLVAGDVQVVVTDGFTGNVALKTAEGAAREVVDLVREAATSTLRAKLGGLLLRPAVRGLRAHIDPETYGGAYLLGLNGVAVITHGSSTSGGIENACNYAAAGVRHGIVDHIAAKLGRRPRDAAIAD